MTGHRRPEQRAVEPGHRGAVAAPQQPQAAGRLCVLGCQRGELALVGGGGQRHPPEHGVQGALDDGSRSRPAAFLVGAQADSQQGGQRVDGLVVQRGVGRGLRAQGAEDGVQFDCIGQRGYRAAVPAVYRAGESVRRKSGGQRGARRQHREERPARGLSGQRTPARRGAGRSAGRPAGGPRGLQRLGRLAGGQQVTARHQQVVQFAGQRRRCPAAAVFEFADGGVVVADPGAHLNLCQPGVPAPLAQPDPEGSPRLRTTGPRRRGAHVTGHRKHHRAWSRAPRVPCSRLMPRRIASTRTRCPGGGGKMSGNRCGDLGCADPPACGGRPRAVSRCGGNGAHHLGHSMCTHHHPLNRRRVRSMAGWPRRRVEPGQP